MNPLPIQLLLATYMNSAINHERQRSVKLSLNFVLRIITMQQIAAVKRSQKTRILIIGVENPPACDVYLSASATKSYDVYALKHAHCRRRISRDQLRRRGRDTQNKHTQGSHYIRGLVCKMTSQRKFFLFLLLTIILIVITQIIMRVPHLVSNLEVCKYQYPPQKLQNGTGELHMAIEISTLTGILQVNFLLLVDYCYNCP